MTAFTVVLAIALVAVPLALVVAAWWAGAGVRVRLRDVEGTLVAEFEATRRAMNDAAGQSWRNLTE